MTKTASLLDSIQHGTQQLPPRILVYGTEKVGKSTFAASAPSPIFIDIEDGLTQIRTSKFPKATSLDDVTAAIETLEHEEHDFSTLVIDSVDWLENLIFEKMCLEHGVESITQIGGGYAAWKNFYPKYWNTILRSLDRIRNERGLAIVLVAHAKVEKFEDPESQPYDRYSPRLEKSAAAMLCEWCDAVLFAQFRIRTESKDLGFKKTRTIAKAVGAGGGERVIRTVGGPACVAGNRFGLSDDLPLSWPAFMEAISEPPAE